MADESYRVTTHDAAAFTDDEISLETALFNTIEAEVWPEDPVTPVADAIAEARAIPARVQRTAFRVWGEDGSLVGSAQVSVDLEHDDNPDVLGCPIFVRHDHRRRGIGTALLREVCTFARTAGRQRLVGQTFSRIPAGDDFAERVGATRKAESHTNHLPTDEVDRELMQAWVRDGPNRAPGYELVAWDETIPNEHLSAFVDLMLVMNEAPRDDLDVNDFTLTPSEWREVEERAAAIGQVRWFLVARRISDGALAGLHDLAWVPAFPQVMFVGSTGVRLEHRGHALGKWMKAAMTLRVLDEKPEVTDIRTGNADSNDAMLGINRQMGYRPAFGVTTWELAVGESELFPKLA
jgi:GNAT superfamily N-acetyltransferase